MALHCWETRGCDEEMASRCPHNIPGERCPGDCKFAVCDRPTHETAWGLDMLENPDVDREVVVKEFCLTCKFFIAHGPKVGSSESIKAREIVDARPLCREARLAYAKGGNYRRWRGGHGALSRRLEKGLKPMCMNEPIALARSCS